MKYTIIGDPHATLKDLDKINHLFDIIEQMGNPTIFLGDLLDNKAIVRAECLNLYYKRFRESKLDFIILIGNHDLVSLESTEHSLETLKQLPNLTIVDKPKVVDGMFFVPYIHDLKAVKEILEGHDGQTLFIHQGIIGYDYGNGYIAEDGIATESIKGFKTIIAGHFHKFQTDGKLTFLGTPFSKSFGESDQDKYIATYDSDLDYLEMIMTDFPQHKTIEVDCSKELPEVKIGSDHIYRFILTGTQAEIATFDKKAWLATGVRIIERPTDDFETNTAIDESVDCVQQFEKWGKDIKQIDEETLKIGAEILRSCK